MKDVEYYAILKINAPQKINDEVCTYNYIVAKCTLIEKISTAQGNQFEVVYNIDELLNPIEPLFDATGKCTNSNVISNIFTSPFACKKQAEILNDEMIRDIIKNAPLYNVKEISKILRNNLNYAKDFESKTIFQKDNTRNC